MPLRLTLLLAPSAAAAHEWPRRLAATGRPIVGLLPFRLIDLARAIAEPSLLGRGARVWDGGLAALLAARLIDETPSLRVEAAMPRGPIASALARTLSEMRLLGAAPARLRALAEKGAATPEDTARLGALAAIYARFDEEASGFMDPATVYREAAQRASETSWLQNAEGLVVDDVDARGWAGVFLESLGKAIPLRALETAPPTPGGIGRVALRDTLFAPLEAPPLPQGLSLLRKSLFAPPSGEEAVDASVEFVTAPGEAAEVKSIARRFLRAAASGIPFEDMGVALARPADYAPLFADLLDRLGVPYRLHPSLPLRFGRVARSLLLLLRCRGLDRARVMEFLTFVPFEDELAPSHPGKRSVAENAEGVLAPREPASNASGRAEDDPDAADDMRAAARPRTAQWDLVSREAGIVSGLDRFRTGLTLYAEEQTREALALADLASRARRENRAKDALDLLAVVERLATTLDDLSGEAEWLEWSRRLLAAMDLWIGDAADREAVRDVVQDLGGLGFSSARASWSEVEDVLEARFEWERLPLVPATGGAVHIGALDAIAGLPFRLVAIPGLVEGGFPGVVRPDPFLLDSEREAFGSIEAEPTTAASKTPRRRGRQLGLFDEPAAATPPAAASGIARVPLPTTQDRLRDARRDFARAISQATQTLVLSYPRADARSGRGRMPSLFFVAAASAVRGRALSARELEALVVEDDLDALGLDDTVDVSERDRVRMRKGDPVAEQAIRAASPHFRRSRDAAKKRWSSAFTAHDGFVTPLPPDLALKLDPTTAPGPISASRLATFSRCGFQYLLQHVLRLQPTDTPEERLRLTPLERGDLFHRVAERFLRSLRGEGAFPVKDDDATRAKLVAAVDAELERLVSKNPPRFSLLWERESAQFRRTMLSWLKREATLGVKSQPAYFELGFGLEHPEDTDEPHLKEPLRIDLKDGRALRVSGKIDRIDRAQDGSLILRDYKTGKAPKDDGAVFRGGKQLQIPFYVLAAARIFPEAKVSSAFLDYVDGGRAVPLNLSVVSGDAFPKLLRGLVDAIASGSFVQEPSACLWCDYKTVCGPQPLLELRRRYKINDPALQRVLHLRDIG